MTLPVDTNTLLTSLQTAKKQVVATDSSVPFLRMTAGEWVYGGDDMEVEEDARWAVNPNSFIMGYIAWSVDGELEGEIMRPAGDDPVTMTECRNEDPDVKWTYQIGVQMVCINGEDEGQAVIYKTNSYGGKKALNGLLDEVIRKIQSNPASDEIVPIIELKTNSYKHKKYGKTFNPILEIDRWASLNDGFDNSDDEPNEDAEDDIEDEVEEQEPAPKRRRKRVAKK